MQITVIGAGLIGITTAWYLARAGHQVSVIERNSGPALEASFANGGQIATGHSVPWSQPQAITQIMRWLGKEDAPLLWRLNSDASFWRWGISFLAACAPQASKNNTLAILRLALDSRVCLQEMRNLLDLEYDQRDAGILHFYTQQNSQSLGFQQAQLMNENGSERFTKNAEQCLQIEPALQFSEKEIIGGVFTPADESGDAFKFCLLLAEHCAQMGVRFIYNQSVRLLNSRGLRIINAELDDSRSWHADAWVVAMGSWSRQILLPLGINLPIVPCKGYSLTFKLNPNSVAPNVSLTDDERKLVFSRLGNRLRVAGMAEFNGFDYEITPTRVHLINERVYQLFPQLQSDEPAEIWSGLRPLTPNNLPIIGKSRYQNLYLNCGHGTLGWTLACGSAQQLTRLYFES